MAADDIAALRAAPLGRLALQKIGHAVFFDIPPVLDHAHPVQCAVAFVQMLQVLAGELRAFVAEIDFAALQPFASLF